MDEHPLDNPIWTSLTTEHAGLALGDANARRYPVEIGPLAGIPDGSDRSLAALRDCVMASGPVILARREPLPVPDGLRVVLRREAAQMVYSESAISHDDDPQIEPLSDADAPSMFALAELTRPGPYAARSHELGQFWGIRQDGQLIAMAGERMHPTGHTEISAVCTHPDHRGRGLGRALSAHVCAAILARGEVPFLHAFIDNVAAVCLYESLGFRRRAAIHAVVFEPAV